MKTKIQLIGKAGLLFAASSLLGLTGCGEQRCDDGKPHNWPKWSEGQFVSPAQATNTFLGVSVNLSRLQYRNCSKCNIEQRRATP